jgi:hypothetical protein
MSESPVIRRVAVALFEGFTVLDVYGPVAAPSRARGSRGRTARGSGSSS